MELTLDEQAAAIASIAKLATAAKKDAEEAIRENMAEVNAETGADRITIKSATGAKLGTVSTYGGGIGIQCIGGMEDAMIAHLDALGLTEKAPVKGWEASFQVVDGMVVDANGEPCGWAMAYEKPATVRLAWEKPEKVREAIGADRLNGIAVYGLLGGAQ